MRNTAAIQKKLHLISEYLFIFLQIAMSLCWAKCTATWPCIPLQGTLSMSTALTSKDRYVERKPQRGQVGQTWSNSAISMLVLGPVHSTSSQQNGCPWVSTRFTFVSIFISTLSDRGLLFWWLIGWELHDIKPCLFDLAWLSPSLTQTSFLCMTKINPPTSTCPGGKQ